MRALRDEIVELGPYAFQEIRSRSAIENCMPGLAAPLRLRGASGDRALDLSPEMAGDLFRIAQEAVVNAGRHARGQPGGRSRSRAVGDQVELRVADDGKGFRDERHGPAQRGPSEPGHLGLASMRERAELLDGELDDRVVEPRHPGNACSRRVEAPVPRL